MEQDLPGTVPGARQEQLQFLRFLAFLNIFIAHAERWLFFPYPSSHCANAAVSFFFMLSGMVVGYSFVGKELTLSAAAEVRFVGKRVRKVYPMYLVTTLLAVIFSGIPGSVITGDLAALRQGGIQLLRNLLLIQSWFPEGAHSFNTVGWFLSTLMFLYACSLPLGWLLNRLIRGKGRYLRLGAAFLGTVFCVTAFCYLTRENMNYWHYQFPPARLGEYAMGMMIGYATTLLRGKLRSGAGRRWILTAAEVFVLAFWFLSLSRPGNFWRNHNVAWLVPNSLLLTVFSMGGGWVSSLFRRRALVWLGDLSFACYLVHQMIVVRLAVCTESLPPSDAGNVFCFLFSLLLTITIAAFLHGRGKRQDGK
ncbi:MAG: acyltransferase family protein [Faecousia sp.]